MSDLTVTTNYETNSITTRASGNSNGFNEQALSSSNGFNEQAQPLVAKANQLGIDVSNFYTTDVQSGETTINTQKLNVAIQEATKQKVKDLDNDTFVKTNDGSEYTKEEAKAQIETDKKTINTEYNANVRYIKDIKNDSQTSNDEEALVDKWNSIKSEANVLTSVTASNTTVLEGVKEFINSFKKLVNETKSFDKDKDCDEADTSVSMTDKNIFSEGNSIKVYEMEDESNTLGNNPFFDSAFKTFDYQEEEEKEAV
ncbi:MAG: hypothetical protein LUH11_00340 [Candidatus Gastranaerophilales bacterium]|nr:hypothetical protein [Candidatus Gastranaerophilales bacterium]